MNQVVLIQSAACVKARQKLSSKRSFAATRPLVLKDAIEKGLEAMRLALSCSGPNASLFKGCCIGYNENDPVKTSAHITIPLV